MLTLQERQRKREASALPPVAPPAEETAGLSTDAAAAENTAAMAVAAGEMAVATAQAQAAAPGSEEHKTAEVRCTISFLHTYSFIAGQTPSSIVSCLLSPWHQSLPRPLWFTCK